MFTDTLSMAPIEECMTPTLISMVRQVETRVITISAISLLLTLAKWCSLSDVYGRKLLFHIGLAGMAVYILVNWFAASRYNLAGYYVFYLQAFSFAMFPAGAVLNPGIFAYVADCTPKSQRGLTMGYIIVALSLGSMAGSAISDYILEVTGDRTMVLRIPLILTALLAIYLTYVPESLRRKPASLNFLATNRIDSEHETANTASSSTFWSIVAFFKSGASMILDPVMAILPGRIPKSTNMATSATPLLILLVHFLVSIADYAYSRLFVSMTSLVFHWDTTQQERHDSFITIAMIVVLLGLLPLWIAAYKAFVADDATDPTVPPDHCFSQYTLTPQLFGLESIKMGLLFSVCSLFFVLLSDLLVPLFPSPTMIYFVLSSVVPSHLFGAVYGAHSICQQLSNVVFGLTYEPLFMKTKATSPLFYFYVSAALVALALFVQTINRLSYHVQ
ncbi:hypothetical protein BGX24_006947 [Mortierella sp. AD032]|nr:hypothetical protein BGX24_006947 [Mortierella sp. AD032]